MEALTKLKLEIATFEEKGYIVDPNYRYCDSIPELRRILFHLQCQEIDKRDKEMTSMYNFTMMVGLIATADFVGDIPRNEATKMVYKMWLDSYSDFLKKYNISSKSDNIQSSKPKEVSFPLNKENEQKN